MPPRTQSQARAVSEGSTLGQASSENALCPRCSSLLDFHTWDGRAFEKCRTCGYYSEPRAVKNPPLRLVEEDPMGISDIPGLPVVREGQLRCQECAHGVDGKRRFCPPCESRRKSRGVLDRLGRTEAQGRTPRPRKTHYTYKRKPCANCTQLFTPTGPRSKFCVKCGGPSWGKEAVQP